MQASTTDLRYPSHCFGATVCKTVRPMLSDRYPVCLSCLSVTLVYCGQTVRWIKMTLGMEVGLGHGHIVLDGDQAPPKEAQSPILAHVCCGQMAGWIEMPLGTEVGLGPGHILLDGDPPSPQKRAQQPPIFGQCLLWPNCWMGQDTTW